MRDRIYMGRIHHYLLYDENSWNQKKKVDLLFVFVANDACPIYKMNAREYCLLKTETLGTVLMMEVGALMVGKIKNHEQRNCRVCRGTEKGMFEFGGSTVILMTEPGKVQPDEDLIRNTEAGYETLVKLGEQVGRKIKV